MTEAKPPDDFLLFPPPFPSSPPGVPPVPEGFAFLGYGRQGNKDGVFRLQQRGDFNPGTWRTNSSGSGFHGSMNTYLYACPTERYESIKHHYTLPVSP